MPEQLNGHLDYEWGMLDWAAERLDAVGPEPKKQTDEETLWRNLAEECFLLHANNLYAILPHPVTEWSERVPVAARDHLLTLTLARLSQRVVDVSADYRAILADLEPLRP